MTTVNFLDISDTPIIQMISDWNVQYHSSTFMHLEAH